MKRLLPFLLLLAASPVNANVQHRIVSSAKISIDAAYSSTNRAPSSYSFSGNNVIPTAHGGNAGSIGGLTLSSLTSGVPAALNTTATVHTAGSAFSLSESYMAGDATPSATSVSSGVIGSLPILSGTTITGSGGVAGSLALTSLTSGVHTCVAGGAGSHCTASTTIETIID